MKKKIIFGLFVAGMTFPLLAQQGGIAFPLAKGPQGLFIGEYSERAAYIEHGTKVNGQMADEGFVLLKNDGSLPLPAGTKISVVGKGSTNLARVAQVQAQVLFLMVSLQLTYKSH